MDIAQIVGLALITTIMLLIIRQEKPVMAVLLTIACAVVIFALMMERLVVVIDVMKQLVARAEVNYFFFSTILKIIGVAYLADFTAAICQDAGESAIAKKVEFAAKVIVVVLAIPIMVAILESLMQLMPG
ncbi:MAG: stage III sporulation protein AD [Syntrophomonadaceae bacterium]|nr:stage III sporulation protein AD [Syntrophomonadaceae bacterium]